MRKVFGIENFKTIICNASLSDMDAIDATYDAHLKIDRTASHMTDGTYTIPTIGAVYLEILRERGRADEGE